MINAKFHGYLDILTVIFFALAPTFFELSETGATLSYALAGIHLAMSLLTDFPMGPIKVIPIKVHGFIELLVGILLASGPWIVDDLFSGVGTIVFSIAGGMILVIWLLTEYADMVEELT
ncbi:MAG: hypothetical protein U5J95_07705 [Balneolaceae bacterium]|nr:hypothetical protein [Balneolaceae bacterium]